MYWVEEKEKWRKHRKSKWVRRKIERREVEKRGGVRCRRWRVRDSKLTREREKRIVECSAVQWRDV